MRHAFSTHNTLSPIICNIYIYICIYITSGFRRDADNKKPHDGDQVPGRGPTPAWDEATSAQMPGDTGRFANKSEPEPTYKLPWALFPSGEGSEKSARYGESTVRRQGVNINLANDPHPAIYRKV